MKYKEIKKIRQVQWMKVLIFLRGYNWDENEEKKISVYKFNCYE